MTDTENPTMNEEVTLSQARRWLIERRIDGEHCPCCDQYARVYRRRLSSSMAYALIAFWKAGGTTEWTHGPTLLQGRRADEGKLRYWGLLKESLGKREDGGRAGWWQVTDNGELFIQRKLTVPEYASVYDGHCFGMTGRFIDIDQALNNRFDYSRLMQGYR